MSGQFFNKQSSYEGSIDPKTDRDSFPIFEQESINIIDIFLLINELIFCFFLKKKLGGNFFLILNSLKIDYFLSYRDVLLYLNKAGINKIILIFFSRMVIALPFFFWNVI